MSKANGDEAKGEVAARHAAKTGRNILLYAHLIRIIAFLALIFRHHPQ